uniref:SSD domain-containing protein n=1 Tax=Meloidogyne hapla TaxID=6305 RepID=A0A1I8BCM5_MELHA
MEILQHAFEILRDKMSIPRMLLQRCPSCYSNFANFFCQFTCSPMQANFVRITEMLNNSNAIYDHEAYISKVEYYVSSDYAQQLFDSCKNVRTTTGDFVLSILCGTSIDNCTPERLFKYIGTYNKAINIPFTIDVIIADNQILSTNPYQKQRLIKPMNTTTFKCNQSSDLSDSPCSCVDCLSACTSSAPFPYLFQILRMYTSEDVDDSAVDVVPHSIKEAAKFSRVQLEDRIINWCSKYGNFVGRHPLLIFLFGLIPSLIASSGIAMIRLTTDPVELWSSPGSDAREQREFFDNSFSPFYRTEQIIIVPTDQSFWEREDTANFLKTVHIGPVFRKDFLKASFNLYKQILQLNVTLDNENNELENKTLTLSDICFKPQWPQNPHCVVMSVFNYFQMDHLFDCMENPYQMSSKLQLSCLGQFGGPVQPYVVLGDFETPGRYETAKGLVITLLVNNYKKNDKSFYNKHSLSLAWEHKFIELLKTYKSDVFNVTFIAERSLEDEIARQSKSDALTVFLSYMFMFIYVAFALGHYSGFGRELCLPFVHSKFILGIFGIIGCILSVSSSIGLFAFFRMSASLIILEVEPFLVLAVGVDNIFIFVHSYQRLANNINQPLPERALSSMPAVQMFSLYAAVAILLNFLLQITFFLAVFVWDIKRQESYRLECCCCLKLNNSNSETCQPTESRVEHLMRKFYAPTLLNKYIRIFIVVFFALWLVSSSAIMNRIKAGLDQKMAVPEGSYVLAHFINMEKYLAVGPPIYFVLRGEYDYHDYILRNQVCSSSGCSANSLGAQLARAAKFPERSYIAHPAMNWVDDYLDRLRPIGLCCRQFNSNETFCSSTINNTNICHHCTVSSLQGQPYPNRIYEFLPNFLEENPSSN